MNTSELNHQLMTLWQQGLELYLDCEQLRFKAPKSLINDDLMALLKLNKADIITLLKQQATRYSGYPLSRGQRDIYNLQSRAKNAHFYNQSCLLQLQKNHNSKQLRHSLEQVLQRFNQLCVGIDHQQGLLKQHVRFGFNEIFSQVNSQQDIYQYFAEVADQAFDLHQQALLRIHYVQQAQHSYLIIVAHHIIADFWAMQQIIDCLQAFYQGDTLPALEKTYKDFVLQEAQYDFSEAKSYWQNLLTPAPTLLSLPQDFPANPAPNYQGQECVFSLGHTLSTQLRQAAKQHKVTPFIYLLSLYQLLLHRYSGQNDINIGVPFSARTQHAWQQLAGHFANIGIIRCKFDQELRFEQLLANNKQQLNQASAQQNYPIQQLVDEGLVKPNSLDNSLFQTAFSWNHADAQILSSSLIQEVLIAQQRGAVYPLLLSAYDKGDDIQIHWRFRTDCYKKSTIERYHQHLISALNDSLKHPNKCISDIEYIGAQERLQIEQINQTDSPIPRNISIGQLFQNTAEKFPHNIAFRDVVADSNYSYLELHHYSNQIAHFLQKQGLKAGDVAGLCLGRCYVNVAFMLACLKSQIIYIPIDPENPDQRINAILQGAKAQAFISHNPHNLTHQVPISLALDSCQSAIAQQPNTWTILNDGVIDDDASACIFFTSGSTGTPKGVDLPHRSIIRLTHNSNVAEITETDRFCHVCNVGFDASNLELWFSLLHGACLLYLPNEQLLNNRYFAEFVKQEKPTAAIVPTALFNIMVQQTPNIFKNFRYVFFGGEAADPHACNLCLQHSQPDYIYNVYGPTENGTYSSVYRYQHKQSAALPIGFVVSNSRAYVVDQYQQIAPIGVIGELLVGGDGLANGYWMRPDLTDQRFIPDTFRGHGLLYKTGDLAWLRDDGQLMYVGRQDQQIKLRGYRIETQEVEQQLLAYPGIEQCCVNLIKAEHSYLAAWFSSQKAIDIHALKRFLAERLPSYMRPSALMQLDKLPLTGNGKIDKRALPTPEFNAGQHYLAPNNALEESLQTLWQDILSHSPIGIEDNFFELGGHSLSASRLCAAINQNLSYPVEMHHIFEHPSIQSLAACIKTLDKPLNSISARPYQQAVPAALSQRRLWFLQQLNPQQTAYNMPLAISIKKPLKASQIQNAIVQLIKQHDVLHCAFIDQNGEPYLQAANIDNWQLQQLDFSQLARPQEAVQQQLNLLSQHVFDLRQAPLIKAVLIGLKQQQILAVCLHHITLDGSSVALLLNDLAKLLNGQTLSPAALQYQDFSYWQQQQYQQGQLQNDLDYWLDHLKDAPDFIALPCDKPRPAMPSGKGAEHVFIIDKALCQALKKQAQQQHISLFMLMIGAFSLLLSRYSGQNALCVGFPIAGRSQAELQNMVGLFVNNLVLFSQFEEQDRLQDYLQQVKSQILQAFAHQDLAFDQIIQMLPSRHSLSYIPYLQATFSLEEHTLEQQIQAFLGEDFEYLAQPWQVAKYDLNLACYQQNDGSIQAHFEYSCDLFEHHSIQRLANFYLDLLHSFATKCQQTIQAIHLSSAAEQQLLNDWNQTQFDYPHYSGLIKMIEQQAAKTPELIAAKDEYDQLTYQTLDQQSSQLANYLLSHYGPQSAIGCCFYRANAMLVALLAILKAGAAYVPLDPDQPLERLKHLNKDAKLALILSHDQVLQTQDFNTLNVLNIDTLAYAATPQQNPVPDNDCFSIIYTSGSTGKPKGVLISQQGIINRLQWMQQQFPITRQDKILQKTPYNFDVSIWELFWPLMQGSQCVFAKKDGHKDPVYLRDLIIQNQITCLHFVPSMLAIFLQTEGIEQCTSLRQVFCSGEALQKQHVDLFFKRLTHVQLHNLYGPTEASIDVSYYTCSANEKHNSIPIGKPIHNTELYILDKQLRKQAIGLVGELYIGGVSLAKGYLNQTELTQKAFIDNPFGAGKLYKTGDLARFLADGNIEYLGRNDNQIKLRGQRLELGEIETALKGVAGISDALVNAKSPDGKQENLQLIAYVLSQDSIDNAEILKQLSKSLPDYMLPKQIIVLGSWPLNANGKLDRKALPEPNFALQQQAYSAPRNQTEEHLCQIWQGLLGLEQVGIDDNFFELGGHSLLATKMAAQIRTQMQCNIELKAIFENPTVESLAMVLLEEQLLGLDLDIDELEQLLKQQD